VKPTLEDVINKAVDGALARARVMLPGVIQSYDESTRRASVQPLVMDMQETEEGNIEGVAIPVLTDVPVVFPGSGGVRIKFPVLPGHECELVFASSSIARLKVLGSAGGPLHPGDPRHHALPDCVAHLGLQLRNAEDADTMIEFTNTEIRAGGSGPLLTKAEFDLFLTWITTQMIIVTPGGPSTPGVSAPLPPVPIGTLKLRG